LLLTGGSKRKPVGECWIFLIFWRIVLWSVYSTWKMAGSGRKSKKESGGARY